MDSKIHKRLVTFVAQMQEGSLGRIPLDRAIKANLDLFVTLRQSGATWVQIANALTSAGARRSDGRFISADQIRSSVSRQFRKSPNGRLIRDDLISRVLEGKPSHSDATPPKQKPESLDEDLPPQPPKLVTAGLKQASAILEKLDRVRKLRGP